MNFTSRLLLMRMLHAKMQSTTGMYGSVVYRIWKTAKSNNDNYDDDVDISGIKIAPYHPISIQLIFFSSVYI